MLMPNSGPHLGMSAEMGMDMTFEKIKPVTHRATGIRKALSLQRMYRAYRSLTPQGRRLFFFIFLNLVYLVLEAGYGLTSNYLGE